MATKVNDRTLVRSDSPNPMTYQMVHTVPGRCRFRVPRLKQEQAYADRLNWFVESLSFIVSIRINAIAESLVICYEPNTLTLESVETAIAISINRATTEEIPIGAISTKTEFRPEINWLERLGLPVTSLGLAIAAQQLALPLIPTLLIGAVVTAASLPFIVRTIETTLREKRLDADILDALWMTFYTIKGDLVAPSLMVSLMETGEALRDTTARVNEREVSQLVGGLNQTIRVERGGQEEWIPVDSVKIGDRVVVCAGERLPVSGRVLRGRGWIDEHELTGELTFVGRSEGQVVHAGTLLLDGKLCILVKRVGRDTRLGLTLQLLKSAPVHDTRVEDYAAKLANMAIAPSLILGGIIFALTRDVSRALAPLHLDFSHGIRLSVPSTVLSALTYAARHGIYIRSGRALEVLARVDAIAFDKTGTLTQGNAAVKVVRTVNTRTSIKEVLTLAASVEKDNKHPVAAAILNAAAAKGVQLRDCETWEYRVGAGIVAQIDGQQVLVGSHRLMHREGIETDVIHSRYPELQTGCFSLVYVARNGKLLGAISYTDPLRPEAHRVIRQLRQSKSESSIETYILTGDNPQVAQEVATQLGIKSNCAHAEVLPQGKVKAIQHLQQQGKVVAFVGEGINDVAALAHADVSISIASGCDMARETADIVLLDDNLEDVIHAIEIAKRSMEIIYQNTALVAVPNISVVLAGIIFALDPILSVIISNGSMLLAELNSFRPLFDPGEDPFSKSNPLQSPKQMNSTEAPVIAELA